ncbi:MAG: PaaI family thioesterase [Oscillospiraceae bacterium]|nr:PaaI family thioesterase [Oscillospiraceae bacterium]
MAGFGSFEEALSFFEGDRFAAENGMVIDALSSEGARCSFTVGERHRNAEGGVMGGAIFTLIDFAFAAAASWVHRPTVAQQVSMNFLSGSRGTRLSACARCRKDGRTSCVYQVDVTDDLGRDVAQAVITGFKLPGR